jgi:hypothetical protein
MSLMWGPISPLPRRVPSYPKKSRLLSRPTLRGNLYIACALKGAMLLC